MTEKKWQEKIAANEVSNAADNPENAEISAEKIFAAIEEEMKIEAAAEEAVADKSRELFEHLFGKDESLDKLIDEAGKQINRMFEEELAAVAEEMAKQKEKSTSGAE